MLFLPKLHRIKEVIKYTWEGQFLIKLEKKPLGWKTNIPLKKDRFKSHLISFFEFKSTLFKEVKRCDFT